MSTPKRYLNEQTYQALASQYVAGLLRGRARVRFVQLMQKHPPIRQSVEFWEQRLDPLNDQLPDVAPPADVWTQLTQQLDGGDAASSAVLASSSDASNTHVEATSAPVRTASVAQPAKPSTRPRRRFSDWLDDVFGNRWFSGASFATVCLLGALLIWQFKQEPALVNYVAVMENVQGQAQFVATSSKVSRELRLDVVDAKLRTGEPLTLWAISKEDGSFYSFGLVKTEGTDIIHLDDVAWKKIMTAQSLVLTREDSPNPQQPSVNQVARGLCVKINYDPVKV